LIGIEGIAAASAGRWWHGFRLLDDRRRSRDLLAITRLDRRLPVGRAGLRRSHRGDVGLAGRSLAARGDLRAALEQPQPFFELPVAILQLLILAGQLPQLILELLNAQRRIFVIGLRQDLWCQDLLCQGSLQQRLRTKRQHRRHCRDAGNSMKSG
jgi:hypothetical protein